MLSGGLEINDNHNAVIIEIDCVHNTETIFANPLGTLPKGFSPIHTYSATTMVSEQLSRPVLLNLSRTDGFMSLTAQFSNTLATATVRGILWGS